MWTAGEVFSLFFSGMGKTYYITIFLVYFYMELVYVKSTGKPTLSEMLISWVLQMAYSSGVKPPYVICPSGKAHICKEEAK